MSRRRNRRAISRGHSQTPLYVIAGLPADVFRGAINRLEERFPEPMFRGAPSRADDGELYPEALIKQLVAMTAEFAIRRRTNEPSRPPSPKSISLIYVPSRDDERLLKAFDFAIMPVRATALAAYGEKGKQLRHDPQAVNQVLVDSLNPSSQAACALAEVIQRLNRRSDREVLLLPPHNFRLADRTLRTLFLEFRRGERRPDDRFNELATVRLTDQDIPRLGDTIRHCHVDVRGIAFPVADPTVYDGPAREVDQGPDQNELLSVLRSLYRFGGPLIVGFHHDAQRADGRALRNVVFECSEKGQITVSARYVNIYPNDYIRVGR